MKFRRQGPFTQSLAPKIWLLHRRKKKQLFGHTFSDFSREHSFLDKVGEDRRTGLKASTTTFTEGSPLIKYVVLSIFGCFLSFVLLLLGEPVRVVFIGTHI